MKNSILCLLLISLCTSQRSFAQIDHTITVGTIDSVQSKILNEKRIIWVHVPASDPNSQFTKERYPVLYLLDGDAYFRSVAGMTEELSNVNGNVILPKMIIVGILNTDRNRDLTPVKDNLSATSGGGDQFLSFIEKELIPYIDSAYPTQPYKILTAHSLGGLTVMHSMIHQPHLFNSYICIEPSLWWGGQKVLWDAEKLLAEKDFTGTTLCLGIANTMGKPFDFNEVLKDSSLATIHIRSILMLDKFIKSGHPKGLRYSSKYYPTDNHGSVPLIATYDALHVIFDKYPFQLTGADYDDADKEVAKNFALHYQGVSAQFGYTVHPPENEANSMAYEFLDMKQYKKAEGFFKLNVANYPKSANAWNAYGDYFVATGDKTKAVENFKKALAIKDDPSYRKKINDLMK